MNVRLTGWFGVPVHELGHALFCLLFRHKITEIKLYIPDPEDDTLGYVKHAWNPDSRFQSVGNFFIAIGPMLLGVLVLWMMSYFMVPDFTETFSIAWRQNAEMAQDARSGNVLSLLVAFCISVAEILRSMFFSENIETWQFWVLLYFSICVASHMGLSPSDIKSAKSGLIAIVLIVLVLNFIVSILEIIGLPSIAGQHWRYIALETYVPFVNGLLGALGALLMYALIISGLHFAISYICLGAYNLVKGRGFMNPF
jgi:hypothetical protein